MTANSNFRMCPVFLSQVVTHQKMQFVQHLSHHRQSLMDFDTEELIHQPIHHLMCTSESCFFFFTFRGTSLIWVGCSMRFGLGEGFQYHRSVWGKLYLFVFPQAADHESSIQFPYGPRSRLCCTSIYPTALLDAANDGSTDGSRENTSSKHEPTT